MDDVRYRLAYPVYVITGPGGQGLQVIDQRGMSLAVVFQHFEMTGFRASSGARHNREMGSRAASREGAYG